MEEKVGRQYTDDMAAAKARRIRADRIEGRRMSRQEIREKEKATGQKLTLTTCGLVCYGLRYAYASMLAFS